jgi:hypothetical protein
MSEHDEGLTPAEWLLLVPTAAIWMINGLAGFALFSLFVGYIVYRQNPDAFGLAESVQRQLPRRRGSTKRHSSDSDDAYLQHLLGGDIREQQTVSRPATVSAAIPWRQWRVWVVKAHHLFIVGNTDSGKTTLARALLPGKKGVILVVDPKNRPGKWGGIAAIGLDDNAEYTQIEQALQMVLSELRQRQRALNRGYTDFAPLTVVVDEAPDVADECPTFPTLFKRVGSIGRELHMSLIVLSQRSTVRPLGIVGDGQSRDNFTKILMGGFAHRAVPALAGQRHCAVLESDGEQHVLDVSPLPTYARLPLQAGVVSGFAVPNTNDDTTDTRYVPGIDDDPGIEPNTSLDTRYTRYVPGIDTSLDTTDNTNLDEPTDDQIRAWAAAGVSRRKIKERLRGSGQYRQERIRQALEGEGDLVHFVGS